MRRAVARGRVFPQSYSTDRRYGRLSIKAVALFPLMWVNADDQGRLCGDPEEIKYAVCPNIDHITKADVPGLLQELHDNKLILCYDTPKSAAIQMLDWWDIQRPQWASPSEYPPPEDWNDRIRYHASPTEIITVNWATPAQRVLPSVLRSVQEGGGEVEQNGLGNKLGSVLPNNSVLESSKDNIEEEEEEGRGRGRGRIPSVLRSTPHPHQLVLTERDKGICEMLKENYRMRWGHVRAENPDKIIPRQLKAKDEAQLRDLAIELSAAGGCPADTIKQAFDEAAGQRKYSVSYVRAVLLDWLGVERVHST